jgi:hypothetical protein
MALFKSKNGVSDVEKEIDQLRTRRKMLAGQQQTATAALAQAREHRRTRLLEQDLDSIDRDKLKNIVPRLVDELDAVNDALVSVDQKLADAESRLAAEAERTAREREVKKRQAALGAARNMLDRFREISRELVDALALLAPCGPACAAAHGNLEYLSRELPSGIQAAFDEVGGYCATIASGDAPIRTESLAAPPAAPPAPKVERVPIFLRGPSRWQEPDGEHTAGPHNIVSPPKPIAELALQYGHAVAADSETARHLRSLADPHPGWFSPGSCLDISQPIREPKPPEVHVTVPVQHSLAGQPRTGTAVATPIMR